MPTVTSLRFPVEFDVRKLQSDLDKVLSAGWTAHYNSMAFSGEWSSVALFSQGGKSSNINAFPMGNEPVVETEIMGNCTYFREVINFFKCEKTTARLLRLGAGAEIKPHSDHSLGYADGVFRIHIPVVTNPDVEFMLAGERVIMTEGSCWYIDANEEHSVKNCGKEDRIHLVIDCERNSWTDELFFKQAPEADFFSEKETKYSPEQLELMIAELEKMDSPAIGKLLEELKGKRFC